MKLSTYISVFVHNSKFGWQSDVNFILVSAFAINS